MDPQSAAVPAPSEAVEPASAPPPEGQTSFVPAGRDGRQAPAPDDRGAASAPSEPSTAAAPTTKDVDYRAQYDGLRGVYQQERTQAQQRLQQAEAARVAAEARAQRAEAAAWQQSWRLQGFSPEQITAATAQLQNQQRLQTEQAKLAADRQALQAERDQFRQTSEPVARQIVAARIAAEEGVPVERIAHLSHPDLMRELAKEIRGLERSSNLASRRKAGTDRAESGGGGGIDVSKMSAHERIKAGLKQFHAQQARR